MGSWKWVPPRLVSFTIGSFSTSMIIMGGRVSLIDLEVREVLIFERKKSCFL